MCELYQSPFYTDDIDYAYQEFEHLLDEILKTPLMWSLQEDAWKIIDRSAKEIIWEP